MGRGDSASCAVWRAGREPPLWGVSRGDGGAARPGPPPPPGVPLTSVVHPRSGSIGTRWRHGRAAWVVAVCPAPRGSRWSLWPSSQTTVQTPETGGVLSWQRDQVTVSDPGCEHQGLVPGLWLSTHLKSDLPFWCCPGGGRRHRPRTWDVPAERRALRPRVGEGTEPAGPAGDEWLPVGLVPSVSPFQGMMSLCVRPGFLGSPVLPTCGVRCHGSPDTPEGRNTRLHQCREILRLAQDAIPSECGTGGRASVPGRAEPLSLVRLGLGAETSLANQ